MNPTKETRNDLVTRDAILMLLSDEEVAKVSMAETATKLPAQAEYLDLDQLQLGIQKANGKAVIMGSVLPREAVHPDTWKKLQAALATYKTTAAASN
jgi:hypothetical protein